MKDLFIGAVCQVLITSIFAILTSPSPATAADGPAPLTGLTDPTLAVGLGPLNYWTFPYPLIDLMKVSRPWKAQNYTEARITPKTLNALRLLDDSGWVREMPPNNASYSKIFH